MICNKCNHNLPDDSEFCQYCGEKIEKAAVEPAETVVEEPKKIENPDLDIDKMSPEEAAKYLFAEQLGEEYIPPENQHIDTTIKTKYCSRCGSPIDNDTKLCTGCGKQYFKGIRLNKKSIAIISLSILLVTSLVFNIVQFINTNEIDERRYFWLDRADALESELQEYKELAEFVDDYVVFVEDDGTKLYHKYECSRFKGNYFWAYNTEAARDYGYTACPYCH